MVNILLNFLLMLVFIYIVFVSGKFYFFNPPFIIIQMVGILLIFWTIIARRIYKRNTLAHGDNNIFWIKEGPYEFIRFPVYSGLLLLASTYVQSYLTLERSIAFLLFVVILLIRVRHDERLNQVNLGHGYMEYEKKTKRIIPYLY